ncbi:efflux RND transporter periplasmic adaptor subunit [Magnetococcales bacterium HHB-1]
MIDHIRSCFLLLLPFLFFSSLHAEEMLSISGGIHAIKDIKLSSAVEGHIQRIFVREGEQIQKGKPLLTLKNRFETLEVSRRKLLWQSKVELASARARERVLKKQLSVSRQLLRSTGSVSREEVDEKALAYQLAVAERKEQEVIEKREKLEYQLAQAELERKTLIAPFSGVVVKWFFDEGEGVEALQPLVQLVDASRCRFIGNIEAHIGRDLKKGQPVEIKITVNGKPLIKKAEIRYIAPVVDPASNLIEIWAEFDNPQRVIRPGLSGSLLTKSSSK